MPIGIHFLANATQGSVFGFGVSGNAAASILTSSAADAPLWLTGGKFGLEASIPGLLVIIVAALILYTWRRGPAKR